MRVSFLKIVKVGKPDKTVFFKSHNGSSKKKQKKKTKQNKAKQKKQGPNIYRRNCMSCWMELITGLEEKEEEKKKRMKNQPRKENFVVELAECGEE